MNWIGVGGKALIVPYDSVLKDHLYVSDDSLQNLITSYIKSTGEEIEKKVGYPLTYINCLVYTQYFDGKMVLPKNINAITKIEKLEDGQWVELTIDPAPIKIDYYTYSVLISSKLETNTEYKLTCTCNLNTSDTIKVAAMKMIAEKFENRENQEVKTYNKQIDFLLCNETFYA